MKILIILVIFYSLDNSWARSFHDERKECLTEQQIAQGGYYKIPVAERKIAMKCLYEKLGYIKNGILQKDVFLEKSKNTDSAKKVKYALRFCGHITPSDPNDLAYEFEDCFEDIRADYFVKNVETISKTCSDNVNLSRDEYATLQYLPVKNITETMKLYNKCVLERHGFLKDNTMQEEIILETSENFVDANHLKAFLKECKGIKEDNENDTAFKLYKCMEEIENKYIQSVEDEYKMVQSSCLKDNQLTPNQVFSEKSPSEPTPTLKIFAKCVFKKMGYIKDGIIQQSVIFQKSERAKYTENSLIYLSRCIDVINNDKEIDEDMLAYNFGKCADLFSGEHFLKEWQIAGNSCEDSHEVIYDDEYPKMKPENPTLPMKYYAACVFKKLNFLKDNTLQENVILKAMDDYRDAEYLKTFLSKCKQVQENEHSDTAFKLFVCMEKVINEHKKN